MANEQQQQPNLNPDAAEFRVNAENGGGMGSVKLCRSGRIPPASGSPKRRACSW
jgi:hypothetical protein